VYKFDGDFDYQLTPEMQDKIEAARRMAEDARFQADEMRFEFKNNINVDVQAQIEMAKEMASQSRFDMAFGKTMTTPFAFAPQPMVNKGRLMGMDESSLYQRGTSALDARRWEDAVEYFNQAAIKGGSRTEGALYWKAYALNQLNKGSEAETALTELQTKHSGSRWADDAKALALQIKQQAGRPVSPEDQTDEEMKILAINGIMNSDPERGYPLLEGIIKGTASPKVKRNALFVLAQSSSPKAQALLEQVARGGSNPDIQIKAIQYMGERRRNNGQTLSEIYAASNDTEVKRAILSAYSVQNDRDRLVAAARNEKNMDLKKMAYRKLGEIQGNAELWQLYQSETTPEGKKTILEYMHNNGDPVKLLNVVRDETDLDVRRTALRILSQYRAGSSSDALVQIYNAPNQDQQIKQSILNSLANQRNATALIAMARAEKDPKMKLKIVEHISNMAARSKEAADYLTELLK